jgi:hypothetical protein
MNKFSGGPEDNGISGTSIVVRRQTIEGQFESLVNRMVSA